MEQPQSQDYNKLSDWQLEEAATNFRNNGQIEAAVRAYQELIRRFEAQGDPHHAAGMQHMIGVSYKIANKTDKALDALADAKQRYGQTGDRVGVGRVLRDEGVTHQYAGDLDQAISLIAQSVDAIARENDPAELGISEAKLGAMYMHKGDLAGAKEWITRGLRTLTDKTDHWFYIATAQMHLAELLFREENYIAALNEINEANGAFLGNGGESTNARRLAEIEAMRALIYMRQNNDDLANQHKARCEELIGKLDADSAAYLKNLPELKEIFG